MVAVADAAKLHIIGGKPSSPHSRPYMLAVYKKHHFSRAIADCGATLIREFPEQLSSRYALTAAHCIGLGSFPHWPDQKCHNKKELFEKHDVVAANHYSENDDHPNRDEHELEVAIVGGQCHEDWIPVGKNSSMANDIAILKLARELEFSELIQPIDLAEIGQSLATGTSCVIAGWGISRFRFPDNPSTGEGPTELQELDVEVVPDQECIDAVGKIYLPEKMICTRAAKGGKGHACVGDSGGPVVCNGPASTPIQYGVISFGNSECYDNVTVMINTNVAYYRDWIVQELKNLASA